MFTLIDRVSPSRTDADGILRLGSALDLIQDCSLLWMASEPVFSDFLSTNNLGMFLLSRQADIIRLPMYGERVEIRTSVYECRSFYGYRNTMIYGEDGSPCVLTWSIGAFVDKAAGRMVRLPPAVAETITYDAKADMTYLDKRITVPGMPGLRRDPIAVRRRDIDFYGHMNNARYVDDAMELLPEGLQPRRLRIEYKAPAKLGQLLYPRLIETGDGKIYILLTDAADKPYTVMEFTF